MAIKLGTWSEVVAAAGYDDPFSLNIDMIYDVAACLWKAQYRSLDSYVAVARQEMVLKHGSLHESLTLHLRRVSRAAVRGSIQAGHGIPLLQTSRTWRLRIPVVTSGPVLPGQVCHTGLMVDA